MRVGVVVGVFVALMVGVMAASPVAWAQAKPAGDLTDADRAKRDADKVFRFIKLQAQRPAAPAAPAAAAAPRVASAPRAAAAPAPIATAAAKGPDVAELLATAPTATGQAAEPEAAVAPLPSAVPAPSPVAEAAPSAAVATAPETEEIELALIAHVQPELPNNRLGNLRDGSVWVQFSVEPDGRTSHVVARPGAQLRLAQSAVKAVQQWRFAPISAVQDVAVEIAFKVN
jgi:TonB family protein